MATKKSRRAMSIVRHRRLRKHVAGTGERPRLSVFRSSKHIYAQLVDDVQGKTLGAASCLDKELSESTSGKPPQETAKLVGEAIGAKAIKAGIKQIVFDRGGFKFHGRVKALADGAREAGLEF